jgi:hypothetical protein
LSLLRPKGRSSLVELVILQGTRTEAVVTVIRSTEVRDGKTVAILIEVDHAPAPDSGGIYGDTRAGGIERIAEGAKGLFEDGLGLARTCAMQVVQGVRRIDEDYRPSEFQISLSIKLDAEVGAILARSSTGAQMQVTMTWKS